jgi:hypothetical protein
VVGSDVEGGLNMPTGKKPASEAGSLLESGKGTPAQRQVAASDLAQAPKKKGKKGKKGKKK